MTALATLDKEHRARWWDFWKSANLGRLRAMIDNHAAWIWDGDKLVAEFTPDQSPADIAEIINDLKKP